jgi:hypothetical protein
MKFNLFISLFSCSTDQQWIDYVKAMILPNIQSKIESKYDALMDRLLQIRSLSKWRNFYVMSYFVVQVSFSVLLFASPVLIFVSSFFQDTEQSTFLFEFLTSTARIGSIADGELSASAAEELGRFCRF